MNALRLLVVGVLMLGVAGAISAKDKAEKKAAKVKVTKEKLAGTWTAMPAKGKGKVTITVTFAKDGKASLVQKIKTDDGDKGGKVAGSYKIDGEKVTVTFKLGEKEAKHTLTVTKLTDTEMVVKNEKDETTTFKKVKAKSK